MGTLTTAAIVLGAVNYADADRIVTLFGRDTGRLSALARAARKSQRRFAGGLGLCSVGNAQLRERPGSELATLEHFDATASFASLGADVARMAHAAYAAELIGKLCAPRQVEPAVYDMLLALLTELETAPARSACACSRSRCSGRWDSARWSRPARCAPVRGSRGERSSKSASAGIRISGVRCASLAPAVAGRCPVLLDGGIRRGSEGGADRHIQ